MLTQPGYAQRTWHTGFRAQWQLNENLGLIGFVANGSNVVSETQENSGLDQSPTVGLQLAYAPNELLSFALGGLVALDGEHNADSGYDAFADVVGNVALGSFTAAVNADLVLTRDGAPNGGDRHCWGAALIAGYHVTSSFGVAARGEYVRDDASYAGADVWELVTGTVTLDLKLSSSAADLAASSALFVLRWENRWEKSNQDVFGKDSRGTEDVIDDTYTDAWFESVLGVVFTTEP